MGSKKLGITQIEKQQKIQELKAKGLWGKKEEVKERTIRSVVAPSLTDKDFLNEVVKMKVLTPYSIAMRYNIRLSTAKDLLEELERRGIIACVRAKIYKPIAD